MPTPKSKPKPPARSDAYKKFIDSMEMNYERWHDGTGYDLDALGELKGDERKEIEQMLLAAPKSDWRNQEALAALGSPQAVEALEKDLKSKNAATRLAAASELHEMGRLKDMGEILVGVLKAAKSSSLFSRVMDEIGWDKTVAAIPTLLDIARKGPGEQACHAAAMLFYLKGLADEPFDWDHRPFFLRFNPDDAADRARAFDELCAKTGLRLD